MALPNNMESGMVLPNGTDLRDVTVLSKADWHRIQTQLHKKELEEAHIRRIREEKEALHNMSKEKVKTWGNTIIVRPS